MEPIKPDATPNPIEEARKRYERAAHAMQTGVAFVASKDPSMYDLKHIRVGVNAAMVEHGALVALLLKKGIITELEYYTTLADAMEAEANVYRERLEAIHGVNIELL